MAKPEPPESGIERPETALANWKSLLKTLVDDVKTWVEAAGWRTRTIGKPVDDRAFGRYTVPVLLMEKDAVEIALNPVSSHVPGAEGAVDLYLVPAYDDIASLYLEAGRWMIHYAFDPSAQDAHSAIETEALPLSEAAILRVLTAISSHAAQPI